MESTFKGIFWTGLVGGVAWFWCAVLLPVNALMEAIGVFFGALTVIGLAAPAVIRAKSRLVDPEVSSKMAKTASQAAAASEEISRVGLDTAAKASTALRPRLKYLFDFSGRATRKEYVICQVLTGIVLVIALVLLNEWILTPLLLILLSGVSLLAFGVRRTRDTGVNQWWFLLILVPPVNLAVIVFLLLVPTDEFKDARI